MQLTWGLLRNAYEEFSKKPLKYQNIKFLKFSNKMSFVKAYYQNESMIKSKNNVNLINTKQPVLLENPEFFITEKDLEDYGDDDEKIVFIEIDKKSGTNFKDNTILQKKMYVNQNEKKSEHISNISQHLKKNTFIIPDELSSIKNKIDTKSVELNPMNVSHSQQLHPQKNLVPLKRQYANCTAAKATNKNSQYITESENGSFSDKKSCIQRSATRDAAETMLRLDTGVQFTSDKNVVTKQLSSKNWREDINRNTKEKDNSFHRNHAINNNECILRPEDIRDKLRQAADTNEDVKFCEWIIANFRTMTDKRKKDVKKAITKILLD